MTTANALALLHWPPCPLQLPEQVSLGPHAVITDVPGFLACQLSRIESDVPPLLQRLAQEALEQFLKQVRR